MRFLLPRLPGLLRIATFACAAGLAAAAFAQSPSGAASQAASPALPAIRTPAAVANPYGLEAMWLQGDWVARITLLILALMSLAS